MVFSTILGVVRGAVERRFDSDDLDRLSYLYTTSLLIGASILVSFKLFGGRPIECWAPAHFTDIWQDYTEAYCWAKNTYFVPFHQLIPEGEELRLREEIAYYQWVPFFFLAQAFSFYAPSLLWRWLSSLSAIRLNRLIERLMEEEHLLPEQRSPLIQALASHLHILLTHRQTRRMKLEKLEKEGISLSKLRELISQRNFLSLAYLTTKIAYALNVFLHLILLNIFLQTDGYDFYGIGALWDILSGRGWEESGNFPRVTICDFNVRVLGAVQKYSVQCVLVINIINEKLFILLWFLFSALGTVCLGSAILWGLRLFARREREEYLKRLGGESNEILLRQTDILFLLRLVEMQAGQLVASQLLSALLARIAVEEGGGEANPILTMDDEADKEPSPVTL